MKKIFKLKEGNKNPQRQLDAIKHEIRKYIKREKRKPLLEGVDFWDLKCRFALNNDEPKTIEFTEITSCLDKASEQDADSIYMEIISTNGYKNRDK